MEVSQKVKNRTTIQSTSSTLDIYQKELKLGSQREIHTFILIVAFFTMAKTWKQPKCPLMEEWKRKVKFTYNIYIYSAFKKKEILPFVIT